MPVGIVNKDISRGLDTWGHTVVSPFAYTGPNPYATGGDPLSAQQFKLGVIELVDIGIAVSANGVQAVVLSFNYTTGKMQAYWQNPTAGANEALQEVDNGTDLSGFVARGLAFGKG